jgi:hypothetical protein
MGGARLRGVWSLRSLVARSEHVLVLGDRIVGGVKQRGLAVQLVFEDAGHTAQVQRGSASPAYKWLLAAPSCIFATGPTDPGRRASRAHADALTSLRCTL